MRGTVVILGLLLLGVSCSLGEAIPPTPGNSLPMEVEGLIRLAKLDLAQRHSVPVEEIAVDGVETVQWPDASLGCPQPGMMYAQVITPGYRIHLSLEGQDHVYHSDRDQRVAYCSGSSS